MRLTEFSNKKLAQYKTAAAADATKADAAGDVARGHKRFKGINTATKKQFDNDAKKSQLKEFAPSGDDGDGFSEETLKRLAAQWYNGDEDPRVEQTLMSAGWEIGQDEGYDNGGVFVVRAGDDQGDSYISWPSDELAMNEGVTEATDPKRDKAERMIWKYFGQIYNYGDDDGLNYLDEQGDLWNQLMDKYNGEIDDIVAQEPIEVLMQAAQELKGIAGDMKYELDEAAQGHTIEAHGVRGMDRRTWHKTFRNTDQMIAWAEKHDAEIIGTRDLEQARHHNLSPAKQDVTEGSAQKPAITYKDYTLQYDYQTEDDDPEGYSTATTYYFDVLKDGDRVGEAEYFDYFGNLTIIINGQTMEFKYRHPLAMQISQLVSSLPDEQKKDLSDPRFDSQGVAEGLMGSHFVRRGDPEAYLEKMRKIHKTLVKGGYKPGGYASSRALSEPYQSAHYVHSTNPDTHPDVSVDRVGNQGHIHVSMKKSKPVNLPEQDMAEGLTEMDKSQPSAGRDGGQQSPRRDRQSRGRDTGPRSGPDRVAKTITKEKMVKHALDALTKSMAKKDDKKKDVSEDSISAMRRLAGIVPQVPVVVPNGQRQYRHMPTAVQPR